MRSQAGTHPVTQFDSPKQSLAGLSTEANAALLSAAADLVLVVDGQGRLCGALNSNDLMRAKVI